MRMKLAAIVLVLSVSAADLFAVSPDKKFYDEDGDRIFENLADRIRRELDATILILWGPGEEAMAWELKKKMKEEGHVACPTSVVEMISLFRRCRLLVAGDTGPLHLAAACGLPSSGGMALKVGIASAVSTGWLDKPWATINRLP